MKKLEREREREDSVGMLAASGAQKESKGCKKALARKVSSRGYRWREGEWYLVLGSRKGMIG